MYLEDVFEDYKRYTDADEEYSSGEFSKKLRKRMRKYGLKDYLKLITPKNKKEFKKETKYTFSKEEKELLGLFLGCATSRKSTAPKKYPNKVILNPLLHARHRESMGISDMKTYTDHYIRQEENKLSMNARMEIPKITELIEFACKLKESMKRLMIAIFYMSHFNALTFDRILVRLNGFIDELYLLNSIREVPAVDLHHTYNPNEFYHSVDILTAADVGDRIYLSKTFGKFSKQEILTNPERQKAYLAQRKRYTSLLNMHSINETQPSVNRDYRQYLKHTITEMFQTYISMVADKKSDKEIYEAFAQKFGADIGVRTVETLLFVKYIMPESQHILSERKPINDAIESTYETIEELLKKAEEESKTFDGESTAIEKTLDRLMFKPFIKFHENDLEKLQKRAEKNTEVLRAMNK